MCGIVGVINYGEYIVDKYQLQKMNNILAHRGPDFGDVFIDGNVGLGHRRLSIIDLSPESNQPMNYRGSDYWVVFNGEIYNFIELKEELLAKGYYFVTEGDTEVILASYIEWGEQCFHKFNGMWALSIYNTKTKEMLICRDRFGVKPLYYYQDETQFLFASEKKAIVLSDFAELEFDDKGIQTAINNPFGLEASGYTEFKNVRNLLPGHLIKVKNKSIEVKQWYRLLDHLDDDVSSDFVVRVEKFKAIFKDACMLRLRADVPIATSLSGGLDSSSIVAMLSELDDLRHKTFVHSFKGSFLDETSYARIVAKSTHTPISEVETDETSIANDIDNILYHFESIYGGMPDSPYRIYKEQRKQGFKISIDGHGADEMLAGYPHYLDAYIKDIPLYNLPKFWTYFRKKKGENYFLRFVYDRLPKRVRDKVKEIVKGKKITAEYEWVKRDLPSCFSNLKSKLYEEFSYTILPRILKNFDAVSMANSIEVRMPFLDYRLVQYVFALPDEDLIHHNWNKYILRKSMDGLLDEQVNWRKDKIGFNSPVAEMMSGLLKEWVLGVIHRADEQFFSRKLLMDEFNTIRSNPSDWNASLEFWKKINTLRLMDIYKEKKGNA